MKTKLPVGVCLLIALALVAFGLVYGTYSGYSEDAAGVEELLKGENGLLDVLSYRGADGLNLCAVARRHLNAADTDLLSLETAARRLQGGQGTLAELKVDDEAMEAAFAAVSAKLMESASFQSTPRDGRYLDMIKADLASLASSAAVTTYNQAAQAFNTQMETPLLGTLAELLGVDAYALYE